MALYWILFFHKVKEDSYCWWLSQNQDVHLLLSLIKYFPVPSYSHPKSVVSRPFALLNEATLKPLRCVFAAFWGLIITPEGASEQWCWGENPRSRHSSQLTSILPSLAEMWEIDMLSESRRAAHEQLILPRRLQWHDPWHSTPHTEPVLLSHWSQFDRKNKTNNC